jgi:hypothetical protein
MPPKQSVYLAECDFSLAASACGAQQETAFPNCRECTRFRRLTPTDGQSAFSVGQSILIAHLPYLPNLTPQASHLFDKLKYLRMGMKIGSGGDMCQDMGTEALQDWTIQTPCFVHLDLCHMSAR